MTAHAWRQLFVLVAWVSALSGCVSRDVTRVVEGRQVVGPFVSAAAYDAYFRGVLAEESGDWATAAAAYRKAVVEDGRSPELWSRFGFALCRSRKLPPAEESFQKALSLDADYEPTWSRRARCLSVAGSHAPALEAARHAARLDPDRLETHLLVGGLLVANGRGADALRWYRSLVARWPGSAAAWLGLERVATAQGDRGWSLVATRWLARHAARTRASDEEVGSFGEGPERRGLGSRRDRMRTGDSPSAAWASVDDALRAGDLRRARAAAKSSRIDPRTIAARAILLGAVTAAHDQAEALLAADPDDTDSRLALALALDLSGQPDSLVDLLELPEHARHASPVGELLLLELVRRHAPDQVWHVTLPDAGAASAGPSSVGRDDPHGRALQKALSDRLAAGAVDAAP